MVVRQVMTGASGGHGSNQPALHVNGLNRRLDEACPRKGRTDRLCAVPQFQSARAGFEQQRRDDEEVLAADERDLQLVMPAHPPLQMARGCHAAKYAAQHDHTHVAPPFVQTRVASIPSAVFVLPIESFASATVPINARMASMVSGMTMAWLSTM